MSAKTSKLRESAADELQDVIDRAEELLQSLGDDGGDALSQLRDRVTGTLDRARGNLGAARERATESVSRVAGATDDYVQENPWKTLAIGAAVGVLIGAVVSRRI